MLLYKKLLLMTFGTTYVFLFFYCNNGCTNTPHCYVIVFACLVFKNVT